MKTSPLALAPLLALALLASACCPCGDEVEEVAAPEEAGESETKAPQEAKAIAPDPSLGKLEPLGEDAPGSEATIALTGGQALVVRPDPNDGSVAETFKLSLIDADSRAIYDQRNVTLAWFGYNDVERDSLSCESTWVGPQKTRSGLLAVSFDCMIGEDVRETNGRITVLQRPDARVGSVDDVRVRGTAEGPSTTSQMGVCVSGYKAEVLKEGGRVKVNWAPYASYDEDQELSDTVKKSECRPPKPREAELLRPPIR